MLRLLSLVSLCCTLLLPTISLADSCQDDFEWGVNRLDSAEYAVENENWSSAKRYFSEAADAFERAQWSCEGENAENARDNAEKARENVNSISDIEFNARGHELFEEAENHFNNAIYLTEQDEYEQAESEFNQAATLWESAASNYNDENKQTSLDNVALARKNASICRDKVDTVDDFALAFSKGWAQAAYESGQDNFAAGNWEEAELDFGLALESYTDLTTQLEGDELIEAQQRLTDCETKLAAIETHKKNEQAAQAMQAQQAQQASASTSTSPSTVDPQTALTAPTAMSSPVAPNPLPSQTTQSSAPKHPSLSSTPSDCLSFLRAAMAQEQQCPTSGICEQAAQAYDTAANSCQGARADLARQQAARLRTPGPTLLPQSQAVSQTTP